MRILGFTSIRADYDLLSGLYKRIEGDDELELEVIVSGANMSSEYGGGADRVKSDGISVLAELETLISSDSKRSRLKTASIFLQNVISHVAKYSPDLLIYAGDREDVICAAMVGAYLQIPTVHFYAGDHVTDGHVDNPVRHATSKLSSVHMVTLPEHKQRLIAMGESPERIRVMGALSVDRLVSHDPLPRKTLLQKFDIDDQPYAVVIFHPQDREMGNSAEYLRRILSVLRERGLFCFVGYPNTDPDNISIKEVIKKCKKEDSFYVYKNMDQEMFLSVYKNASIQVGNSSSGIIEAASIPLPVVNVGMRQKNRKAGKNVIFSGTKKDDIKKSVEKALSDTFIESIKEMDNIYGDGRSIDEAYRLIRKIDLSKYLYKEEDPINIAEEFTVIK